MSQLRQCIPDCKLKNETPTVPCYGECFKTFHSECINVSRENQFFWKCPDCAEASSPNSEKALPEVLPTEVAPAQSTINTPRISIANSQESARNLAELTIDGSPGIMAAINDLCEDVIGQENEGTVEKSPPRLPIKKRLFGTPKRLGTPIQSFTRFISALSGHNSSSQASTAASTPHRQGDEPTEQPISGSPLPSTSRPATEGGLITEARLQASVRNSPPDVQTIPSNSTPGTSRAPPETPIITRNDSSSSSDTQVETQVEEFKVDKIVGYGLDDDGKSYLYKIRWVGFSKHHDTWEPENNLTQCYEMVASFKRLHDIGRPTFPRILGNTQAQSGNVDNWHTSEEIKQKAIGYLPSHLRYTIEIVSLEPPAKISKEDRVYIICHEHHAMVGLYLKQERVLYLADGENAYLEDVKLKRQIDQWLKVPIRGVKFLYQTHADHCSSSAAILITRFVELYAAKQPIPRTILVSRERLEKLKKTFHKAPSERITGWVPINERETIKCDWPGCNVEFKKRDGRKLIAHKLHHRK